MQNIEFQKIHLENCGCHNEIDVEFKKGVLTGIIGKNGRGKSTIFKSLMVGLFGDTGEVRESTNIGDLVNRKYPKNLFINIHWTIDGIPYEVRKYQNHKQHRNKTILLKGDNDISGKSVTETHKKIESILTTKSIFRNTVYFSQQMKDFFTSLTNSDQKRIFNSIFNFEIWEKRQKYTDNLLKKYNKQYENISRFSFHYDTKITERNNYLIKIQELQKQQEKQKEIEKQELIDKNKSLKENIKKLVESEKQLNYDKSGHDEIIKQITKLEIEHNNLKSDTDKQMSIEEEKSQHKIELLKSEAKEKFQYERNSITKKFADTINDITIKINNNDSTLSEQKDKLNEQYKKIQNEQFKKTNHLTQSISDLKIELQEINSDLNNKLVLMSDHEKKLKNIKKEIDEIKNKENAICIKCGQILNKEHKKKVLDDLKKEMTDIPLTINKINECINELKIKYDETSDKIQIDDNKLKQINILFKEENDKVKQQLNDIINKHQVIDNELKEKLKEVSQNEEEEIKNIQESLQKEYKLLIIEQINNKDIIIKDLQKYLVKKGETIYNNIKEVKEKELLFSNVKEQLNEIINKQLLCKKELNLNKDLITSIENKVYDDIEIKETQREIRKLKNKYNDISSDLEKLKEYITILTFWKEAFSDRGIKSMLIDGSLPYLNSIVREELERLTPGKFILTFDTLSETKAGDIRDKFNVHILNTETGADKHKLLSGGEKRVIDVCTLMGLRKLTESIHNKKFNILLLDEVLDSLDADNSVAYLTILKKVSSELSVNLITHSIINSQYCDDTLQL